MIDWQPISLAPDGQRVLLWDKRKGLFSCGRILYVGQSGYEVEYDVREAMSPTHFAFVNGPVRGNS